jgi:hypothetical protein
LNLFFSFLSPKKKNKKKRRREIRYIFVKFTP